MRRRTPLLVALLLAATAAPALASTPVPEANFATTLLPRPCTPEPGNLQEAAWAERDGWQGPEYERYPGACQRLRFVYGPITVRPGQNDVLLQPVTVEKPGYDGYLTRFDPDLVKPDGTVPPIEQVHLHHAVWTTTREYGLGPFMASGEEKTIFAVPKGYGMPVAATDDWQLLYMIHSAVPQPTAVYITYDVDYVAKAAGQALGLKPAYPVWMDVRPSSYPVFNTQRGFGTAGECTWPRQKCANFDPWGKVVAGQGAPATKPGTDLRLPSRGSALGKSPNFQGGTLIAIGGHLHPGGIRNEVDLVRGTQRQRIYTSDALYWDRTDSTRAGGPPTSWDFSIGVQALPRWGVRVQPGDVLRSNATYDTTIQSVYEAMGISVAYIAPDLPNGAHTANGVDPFTAPVDETAECTSGGLLAPTPTLCTRGWPTHGHLHENDNFGGPSGTLTAAATRTATSRVDVASFAYAPGDLSLVAMTGLPTVQVGSTVRFTNADALLNVYHTVTSCAYPCTGATGVAFPVADGATSVGRKLDFDSAELGLGVPSLSAAKNEVTWDLDVSTASGYRPGEVVTYFCRVHPFMRGAFEVTS
jgi:plastocyanin